MGRVIALQRFRPSATLAVPKERRFGHGDPKLAGDPADAEPLRVATDGRRLALADHHARERVHDDADLRPDRRPPGTLTRRRGHRQRNLLRACARGHRDRPRRQQHDQRLLRPRERSRHRRLRSIAVCAPPGAVGPHLEARAPRRNRPDSGGRSRDPRVSGPGARSRSGRVRAAGPLHQRLLRGTTASANRVSSSCGDR
jgi:hypothetical protein